MNGQQQHSKLPQQRIPGFLESNNSLSGDITTGGTGVGIARQQATPSRPMPALQISSQSVDSNLDVSVCLYVNYFFQRGSNVKLSSTPSP